MLFLMSEVPLYPRVGRKEPQADLGGMQTFPLDSKAVRLRVLRIGAGFHSVQGYLAHQKTPTLLEPK